MSAPWIEVPIASIAHVARGGSPRPISNYITSDETGVNWIKIGDTEKGGRYIFSTKEKIRREGITRSRWVNEGDFLLSNSMSFGRPYVLKTSGCIHDGWLVLKPDYSRVDQDYLYYALSSPHAFRQFDSLAAGSTVRNLNINLVAGVTILLPPLEAQKRIVAVLDQAFAALDRARAHAEANLADAQGFLASFIEAELHSSGGEISSLQELMDVGAILGHLDGNHGNDYPRKDEFVSGGVPYVAANCVVDQEIDLSRAKFLSEERAAHFRKGVAQDGDVIFAHNATVGPVALLKRMSRR